jgi:RNA polymerase sigma factor (sigma-70 family)
MPAMISATCLSHFASFIQSRGNRGWEEFWADDGEKFVTLQASEGLRRRRVTNGSWQSDPNAVEEVVSLTILKLVRIATGDLQGGFDVARNRNSPSALAGWLSRVVNSQVHDYIRIHRCTRDGIKLVSFDGLQLNDGLATTDAVERHDRAAKQFVARDLVMHLMNKLSEDDRRILKMSWFRGLTQREIARELRVSPATACRLVRDAQDRLKKLIDPKTGGI